MRQITHVPDVDDNGQPYMRQVVSAEVLRRVLRQAGETLARPSDFGPRDEWIVR